MSAASQLRMLTFGPMIDSELTRFVLWRYRLAYVEERHIFGWVSLLALLHGGTGQIPLTYGTGPRLTGPRALVDFHERICDPAQLLLPATEPARTRVEADWALFNGELGGATARLAYFHLLPCREPMIAAFSRGMAAGTEVALVRPLYGVLQRVFVLLLRLGPEAAADALARIRRIVDDVDHRLADGRRFVGGDTATLADLAFATALAPLILPEHYTAPIPDYADMPPALRAIVDAMRARPAAALVRRIYDLRAQPRV